MQPQNIAMKLFMALFKSMDSSVQRLRRLNLVVPTQEAEATESLGQRPARPTQQFACSKTAMTTQNEFVQKKEKEEEEEQGEEKEQEEQGQEEEWERKMRNPRRTDISIHI